MFTFLNDLSVYCEIFCQNIVNAPNLATLEPYSHDISCTSSLSEVSLQDCLGHSPNHGLNKTNSATLINRKYKERFVSPNVINWSRRNLV